MRAPFLVTMLLASAPALADPPAPVPPAPPAAPAPPSPATTGAAGAETGATSAPPKPRRRAAPRASAEEDEEDEDAPEVVPRAAITPRAADPPVERWKPGARIAGWVLLGAAGALLVSSVATFGAEGYYASRWNDDARCLVGGRYRVTTCHDEYDHAVRTETLAVELALATGAAGVTAAVLLLTTRPSAHKPRPKLSAPGRAVACGPGPGSIGLSCAGAF